LPRETVIESKPGLTLVSWMYKDIVHYGFQDDDGGMLETFRPTAELKGQKLRAYVIAQFRSRNVDQYMGKWPSITMDVNELMVGQVIVYEGKPGKVVFSKIVKIGPSLIFGVTREGGDTLWLTDRMNEKLIKKEIQVIALETVPEQLRNFPKSKYED